MDMLLIEADNNERAEKLGQRETTEELLFLLFKKFICLRQDLSYVTLDILELVIWTKQAWNS